MVIKKSPPKQKHHFSRRTIIVSLVALILALLAVVNTIQSTQKQELNRKDREKFTLLETDMTKLQTQLNMSAGAGEWSLDKSCSKPGIKFYTGDAGSCRIDLKPQDADANATLEDIKSSINMIGKINSEGYDKVADRNYVGFTFKSTGNKSIIYFVKKENSTVSQMASWSSLPSLHMYYPER